MVYVIRGSEDGIMSVQGSFKKAYDACVSYLKNGNESFTPPTFTEFKNELKGEYSEAQMDDGEFYVSCHRMPIE